MYEKQILQYIDDHQEEMVKSLEDFVAIASVSDDLAQVIIALKHALSLGEDLGFSSKSLLNDQIGLIEMGQGDEVLGILSHIDVVSPGDLSKWETPPFKATIKDGKMYGRGTLDDKGAIIAVLYAMKAVANLNLPIYKKAQLILGTQEEVTWTDMNAYVDNYPLPDYGFTPDGSFPICNIEKGLMDIELIIPIDLPDTIKIKPALRELTSGKATNVVPGECEAILENLDGSRETIVTAGKSVHSCQPEKGENALVIMGSRVRETLLAKKIKKNNLSDFLIMLEERFQSVFGEGVQLKSPSEYYNGEYVHRNTISPTLAFTKEGNLHVNFNIRFPYGESEDNITNRFGKLAEEFHGAIGKTNSMPAVYVSKDKPFLKVFADAYEKVTNIPNEFVLEYGGTYAKAIPNTVSWGPIFPGEEDTCHEENEYISIQGLLDNAKIFALAIAGILLTEESYR
jgi:succinyl-diaminopimelate desuccinylase